MNLRLILAIFTRNFFSYFANPTGYVFICGFVLVSGFAAFWSHDFWNANLANLDQLNKAFPFIMLGFVPAITMSIWADERRQGTDELLLTLPATDLDVVAGKYLAAVAIFSVSLLFSLSNVFVLLRLGSPDFGLMFTTYLGYWFVGIAMLAVGMVASFLTGNLTVGFVLGAAFNAPLVFANHADVIVSDNTVVQNVRQWSIGAMFADFARGVVSLASLVYFLSIVAIGLYLSMVLIGRRHWVTGSGRGGSMLGHFVVRAVAVVLIAIALSFIFRVHDSRVDASSEKLSSLSPKSRDLLSKVGDRRFNIEAFISPESAVPEAYIQTRLNLLNTLNEIQKSSGGKVGVRVYEIESFSREKTVAEQRYGIRSRTVFIQDRGQSKQKDIFLGVAINSGLDKMVIPFFDKGVPTEYELINAIVSLSRQSTKETIGVVRTDAPLFAGMSMMMMGGQGPQEEQFITELKKQYDVVEVDPLMPIENRYKALLVVQPSSLEHMQLVNLINAIKAGVPTAIFEDPLPAIGYRTGQPPPPGTVMPRRPKPVDPMMVRMGMQPQMPGPKGRLSDLWNTLGVELETRKKTVPPGEGEEPRKPREVDVIDIVFQDFNPFPRASWIEAEFVFVGLEGGKWADDEITRGLQYVLFPLAGAIMPIKDATTTVVPLVQTAGAAGLIDTAELIEGGGSGQSLNQNRKRAPTKEKYTLAARITGKGTEGKNINVVLVSDTDVLSSFFYGHRDQGVSERVPFFLDVDNVAFALNIVDSLAGEKDFFDIRTRRRQHRALTAFEKSTEDARRRTLDEKKKFNESFDTKIAEIENDGTKRIQDLLKDRATGAIDDKQFMIGQAAATSQLNRILAVERVRLQRIRDEEVQRAESELELSIRGIQNNEKRLAVFIPPILPLLIGLGVFLWRRTRELEGAVKSRVRS